MLNTIEKIKDLKCTTIAAGDITPVKIRRDCDEGVYWAMFQHVGFDVTHCTIKLAPMEIEYEFSKNSDGSYFFARISVVGENQNLRTVEEALEDDSIMYFEYFEVDKGLYERDFFELEITLKEANDDEKD